MSEVKYSIVIPTRNRPHLLHNLIKEIDIQNRNLLEIIIIDSSDTPNSNDYLNETKICYVHTKIRSAAIQRNIGIKLISSESKNTFFLDDDVRIDSDYFEQLNNVLQNTNAIGASGVALNLMNKNKRPIPAGINGLLKRLFLLDSKMEGKVLKSAVNIPCRLDEPIYEILSEVEWLIGCAVWNNKIFKIMKFNEKFLGQSVGEDLLFSCQASQYGKLIVHKRVILNHMESEIERPNKEAFFKMWIRNRYVISKRMNLSPLNIAFHWAKFGKIIS
jgi:glycosyltransferase involved in cell wall biosynthesis